MSLKKDIRTFNEDQLKEILTLNSFKPFRAKQILHWIWNKSVHHFDEMSNIPVNLIKFLKENFVINCIKVHRMQKSSDGTIKNAIQLYDGYIVECVLIPTKDRITACVSSQVGCSLNCKFCATAKLKRMRNLNPDEIYDQVVLIRKQSEEYFKRPLTNIVFMGMGEPLLNYEEVKKACGILMDNKGLDFSRRRITLSTAGIVPKIKTAHEEIGCMIAVSLHATENKTRDILVPINKKWNLEQLLGSLRDDVKLRNSERVTFEYVMLDGINDTKEDAHRLVRLLQGLPSKINLIPFNNWTGSQYKRSSLDRIKAFRDIIIKSRLPSPIRKPRGEDIMAACGQLKSNSVKEKVTI